LTEYVTDRRLARAYAMLTDGRNGGLPISSVAFEVGFTDHPYFNRCFRRRYGASPSEVRAGERLEGARRPH
jgi:AraC-like DNA-binding protein